MWTLTAFTIILVAHIFPDVSCVGTCITRPLYPYGAGVGDAVETEGDDNAFSITLQQFTYYGNTYTDLWISINGYLSFGPRNVDIYPQLGGALFGLISGFWNDHSLDVTDHVGSLNYRQVILVDEPGVVQQVTSDTGVIPEQVIIITWKDVPSYGGSPDLTVTHQLVLVTSANSVTHVIFNYGLIDWIEACEYPSVHYNCHLAGFQMHTGHGDIVTLKTYSALDPDELVDISQTAEMEYIADYSNVGIPGRIVHRVDTGHLHVVVSKIVCRTCLVEHVTGAVTSYDDSTDLGMSLPNHKYILTRSNKFLPDNTIDGCRFSSRVTTGKTGGVSWLGVSVGIHPKNPVKKSKRNIQFNSDDEVQRRGHGVKGETITFPFYEFLNDDVEIGNNVVQFPYLLGVDIMRDGGWVVWSATCPFAYYYIPHSDAGTSIYVSIGPQYEGRTFGMCQNDNGNPDDDHEDCQNRTLIPVDEVEATCACSTSDKPCLKIQK